MKRAGISELYDPALIHSVRGLELISRNIVETYLSGVHRSLRTGYGMEFSQYRPYEPGDDLRMLDWKLVARREKYYIRQAEIESNTAVHFILDASSSMLQESDGRIKMDWAKIIIATLAYLANQQGDALALHVINEHSSQILPAERKHQQYFRLLDMLTKSECKGKWPGISRMDYLRKNQGDRLTVFFLSDFYGDDNHLINSILSINSSSIDIHCLHLTDPTDWDPPLSGGAALEDLESGARIGIPGDFTPAEYAIRWDRFRSETKHKLLENGISYFCLRTDQSLPEQLKQLLKHRRAY